MEKEEEEGKTEEIKRERDREEKGKIETTSNR